VVIFGVSDSGKAVIPRYSTNEIQDVKFPCHPLSVCPHLWSISAPQASGNEVTTLQTKPQPKSNSTCDAMNTHHTDGSGFLLW